MNKKSKIYIAGHTGLVGSAVFRNLKKMEYANIITRLHSELELTCQKEVNGFFEKEKPEYVILAAGKVGGIMANKTYPADFIYINNMIQSNVINASWKHGVKKLLFFGSSCIYPRRCPQPMIEENILTGSLEPTNEAYAVAKIAGIKMCQSFNRQYGTNFITVIPANLYGPNDYYDAENSHLIPALLMKFHNAKILSCSSVTIWGTGKPKREFLYVDDCANACIFIMNKDCEKEIINIGFGLDMTIKQIAKIVAKVVGYKGKIVFDPQKPDGMPRKLLNSNTLEFMGWKSSTSFENGLIETYNDYLKKLIENQK